MYVAVAFEIVTIAEIGMLMAASNTVMTAVLAFAAAHSGNTKAALVYGVLSVLSFYTCCMMYNAYCTVEIVGNKGSVCVEFDNKDPYSPKLNGQKIKVGTPYETGVDGENYVAGKLGMEHNTSKVSVNGRKRIPDFYSEEKTMVVEVKNVEKLSYTSQLKDYVQIAQDLDTKLILYVRKNTLMTPPLQAAIDQGLIEIEELPW